MPRKPTQPMDLIDVIRSWTERARRWAEELKQVAPHIDYIDSEPIVAEALACSRQGADREARKVRLIREVQTPAPIRSLDAPIRTPGRHRCRR